MAKKVAKRKFCGFTMAKYVKFVPHSLEIVYATNDDARDIQCINHYRNQITGRDEFIFYTNRLACLLVEYALSFLPYQVITVCCSIGVLLWGGLM